jgi:hypothetical protein
MTPAQRQAKAKRPAVGNDKAVAKKVGKALTGGSDEDQLKNLQKKMGVPQTGKKPTSK